MKLMTINRYFPLQISHFRFHTVLCIEFSGPCLALTNQEQLLLLFLRVKDLGTESILEPFLFSRISDIAALHCDLTYSLIS